MMLMRQRLRRSRPRRLVLRKRLKMPTGTMMVIRTCKRRPSVRGRKRRKGWSKKKQNKRSFLCKRRKKSHSKRRLRRSQQERRRRLMMQLKPRSRRCLSQCRK